MKSLPKLKVGCIYLAEDTSGGKRWGFPDSKALEDEIRFLRNRIDELKTRFERVEFTKSFVIRSEEDVIKNSEHFIDLDLFLVFMLVGGAPAYGGGVKIYKTYGHSLEALWGFNKPIILFVRAEGERIYDGNFRALALLGEHLVEAGRSLWLLINDWEKLSKILKVMEALKMIKNLKVISIGHPCSALGSYNSMRELIKKFGVKVVLYPFNDLVKLYKEVDGKEVEEMAHELLDKSRSLLDLKEEEAWTEVLKSLKLYIALKRLMREKDADVITINCYEGGLSTLRDVAPCLALSKLSDEGYLGVCESDFAAMAPMILARYIANKPPFLGDIVLIPDKNRLLLGHCSSPTKFKGFDRPEIPYLITTQYETGKAATTKVLIEKGEVVTIIAPSLDLNRFILALGKVVESPNLPICRNQVVVEVDGDLEKLIEKTSTDIHWILVFGNYLDELRIACRILGIEVVG